MADRNRDLVPGNLSLVRERALSSHASMGGTREFRKKILRTPRVGDSSVFRAPDS